MPPNSDQEARLFLVPGSASTELAEAILKWLHTTETDSKAVLCDVELKNFADGETSVRLCNPIRGADIFLIASTAPPDVNNHLMELLLLVDACKRASARRINAVIPYYGYARQDRKSQPRTPISAKLVASLLETAGIDRLVTLDLHAQQIQGFFDVPVDHLSGSHIFLPMLSRRFDESANICVVSPDAGGVVRARKISQRLMCPLAIIDKRRQRANQCEVMHVIGEVKNKICIIIDDLIDTAGTLCNAANALKEHGADQVVACITHPVLSGPAHDRIRKSALDELICSDTINLAEKNDKITVLSAAELIGTAIRCIHAEESLGENMIERYYQREAPGNSASKTNYMFG